MLQRQQEAGQLDDVKTFRSDLEDTIAVLQKVGPHCQSLDDLVSICQLGLKSDAQCRFLISLLTAPETETTK